MVTAEIFFAGLEFLRALVSLRLYFPLLVPGPGQNSERGERERWKDGGKEDEYRDVAPQTNMRVLTATRRFDVPSIKRLESHILGIAPRKTTIKGGGGGGGRQWQWQRHARFGGEPQLDVK